MQDGPSGSMWECCFRHRDGAMWTGHQELEMILWHTSYTTDFYNELFLLQITWPISVQI